jgi:hypothetical protein
MHDVRPFALAKENVTYGRQSKNFCYLKSPPLISCLKGQSHVIFDFRFFFLNQFSPSRKYPIKTVSNFVQQFLMIFAAQGAPPPVPLTPVANGINLQ